MELKIARTEQDAKPKKIDLKKITEMVEKSKKDPDSSILHWLECRLANRAHTEFLLRCMTKSPSPVSVFGAKSATE